MASCTAAPLRWRPRQVTYNVQTADNTANTYDIGLYSSAGTLLAHIGSTAGTTFAPSTGWKTLNWTAASTIKQGKYYLAITTSCTSSCAALIGSSTGVGFTFAGAVQESVTGGRHTAELDHDSGRRLHGDDDSNLVAAMKDIRPNNLRSIAMTRFLPAIFLMLLASAGMRIDRQPYLELRLHRAAGLQRHGHEELHGPLRNAGRDQGDAGASLRRCRIPRTRVERSRRLPGPSRLQLWDKGRSP